MYKRISKKIKFKEVEYVPLIVEITRLIYFNYLWLLMDISMEGEFAELKPIVKTFTLDDEMLELLWSSDDEVVKLTVDCLKDMDMKLSTFCNFSKFDVEMDIIPESVMKRAHRIFNFLAYEKYAPNYRLYLRVLKYYTISISHLLYWLKRMLCTGLVDVPSIRAEFGRDSRRWKFCNPSLAALIDYGKLEMDFINNLVAILQRYSLQLDDLIKKNKLKSQFS
ncbi:hypothetical protein [Pedobacter sp. L105]|uniref:hypothetical protein n=1 Tax=Pedobacter sp. L105 TaxID=1641871 RepID=UPI00131ABB46|nr:hypothetical protein [Pedobacter sp. L105]